MELLIEHPGRRKGAHWLRCRASRQLCADVLILFFFFPIFPSKVFHMGWLAYYRTLDSCSVSCRSALEAVLVFGRRAIIESAAASCAATYCETFPAGTGIEQEFSNY